MKANMAQRLAVVRKPGFHRYLSNAENPHVRGYNGTRKFNDVVSQGISGQAPKQPSTGQQVKAPRNTSSTSSAASGGLPRNSALQFSATITKGITGRAMHTSTSSQNSYTRSQQFHNSIVQGMSTGRLTLHEPTVVGSTYNGTANFNNSFMESLRGHRKHGLTNTDLIRSNRTDAFHAAVASGMSRPLYALDDITLTFTPKNRTEAFNVSVINNISSRCGRYSWDDMTLTSGTQGNRTEALNVAIIAGLCPRSQRTAALVASMAQSNRSQAFNRSVIDGMKTTTTTNSMGNRSDAFNTSIMKGTSRAHLATTPIQSKNRSQALNDSVVGGMTTQKVSLQGLTSHVWPSKPISVDYTEKPRVRQFNHMMSLAMTSNSRRPSSSSTLSA